MRARALSMVAVVGLVAGCGGDDSADGTEDAAADDGAEANVDADDGGAADDAGDAGGAATPAGPAAMNTIQVDGEVWDRTLPMTTGQCFVQNVEGLPPSGVAWGTLDGDDELRFSASQNQDASNEAEVETPDVFWVAGPRVADGPDDLVIELDFDALTIVGSGTFTNLYTGETAAGSFAFQCEDDGTGG